MNEFRLTPLTASDYRSAHETEIDALPDFAMRMPCRWCAEPVRGKGPRDSGGQAVIFCAACRRSVYNAPKHETGRAVRSVNSRPDLRPGQRQRILERDWHRCQLCGRDSIHHSIILHVGHILSVAEGREIGATDKELFDDENLFASCEECNLAYSSRSLPPLMAMRLIRARLSRNGFQP